MTRNGELPFYVVQFLELPYEDIDEYVCVPHTWIIVRRIQDGKAVVAYPEEEDPFLTRYRAKRKERCSDEWKFYMAVVKHQSNSYENANNWIASRIYHRRSKERIANNLVERKTRGIPNTQPESTPNTNSRNSSILNDDPRKQLKKILIKRPALSEPERNKQLDEKRMKPNKTTLSTSSSTSVTDANTESKRKQPTSIQDNQSTKIAQRQKTAAVSNIYSRTEQKTQTQRTVQNKEVISLPVIDVDELPEVREIDDRHHSHSINTSNQNNGTSHSHLSNNTAAVSMLAAKPSTSTKRSTQTNQYINQEHILDSRSSKSNFNPQIENVRSLANAHNDHEPRNHDVSNNPQTTSHNVINSFKKIAQPCDNVNRIEDLVETRNAIEKNIPPRNMKTNSKIAAQKSSNSMDQPGSSSARAVEEQSAVVQTRSQDGTDQTASLWEIAINFPEIQHASKRTAEKVGNAPLASQNLPSSSYVPFAEQISTRPSNPLYQTSKFLQQRPSQLNQQDSQRQRQISEIRTSVSNELQNEMQISTLQGVSKKVQTSVLSNILKSIQLTLSATLSEQQAKLRGQSTEHNNIAESVTSDKHQNVLDNARQTGECIEESLPPAPQNAATSDSDAVTDEEISDYELSTDRAPVEKINNSTSTGIASASSSADRPTVQNSTSMNPTTRVRFNLEQQMLDNLCILFTQMNSTLRYITDMYNTLRSLILDTAKIYKELLGSVEQFNSMQKSADNESLSTNLKPQVHQAPEERHTEVTASTQDQHSNDDANNSLKKKHNSWRIVLPPEYDPCDTKWTLKFDTSMSNLPGLVELMPQSGVYVSSGDLNYCLQVSKDCKSLARRLLCEVFSRNALSVCLSMSERAQASDNVGCGTRPELDVHACTVLLSFVLEQGLQRGWNTDLQPILTTVHCKMQEIRSKYGVMVQC